MISLGKLHFHRHTGIVVRGTEYFFGGMGIEYCPPVRIGVNIVKIWAQEYKLTPFQSD